MELTESNKYKLNKHSLLLIEEFEQHYQDLETEIPDAEKRLVFEGWAIQKISNLQVVVTELTERIIRLEKTG